MNYVCIVRKIALVALTLFALSGCAAPEKQASSTGSVGARDSLPCEEVLRMQTADAHPDIKWVVGDNVSQGKFVSCLLGWKKDSATIEVTAYLTSDLYKFVGECPVSGREVMRVFEYKNKTRPYLLRLHTNQFVDPYTYIVVGSYPRGSNDYYLHRIVQKTNDYEQFELCRLKTGGQ